MRDCTQPIGNVAPLERRWVVSFSVFALALTSVPYLVGWAAAGDGWHFSGFVFGVEDGNSYIAKMLRGAHGAWLFQLSYSAESHPVALMFLFHILLGKLAGLLFGTQDVLRLHSALVFVYHFARVVVGIVLLLVSYRFLAEFLQSVRLRRIGLVLVAFGGGLGWIAVLMRAPGLTLDFYSPEAFTFLTLYGLPHLAAARALWLAALLLYWSSVRTKSLRPAWGAGGLWLGVALIQPFYVALLYVLLVLHVGFLWLRAFTQNNWEQRRFAGRAFKFGIVASLPSLPIVLYTVYLFQSDPVYRQWSNQNLILSPPSLDYLIGWGLLLLPALLGLRGLRRRHELVWSWALVWLLALPLLLYAPFNLQRRSSEAIQLPLIGLALHGIFIGGGRYRNVRKRWGPLLLLAMLLPSSALLLIGGTLALSRPTEPLFIRQSQADVFACLADTLPGGSIVLSRYEIGNPLPAYAPLVSYIGHGPETVFLAEKRIAVEKFFDIDSPSGGRIVWWHENGSPALVTSRLASELDLAHEEYELHWQIICTNQDFAAYAPR